MPARLHRESERNRERHVCCMTLKHPTKPPLRPACAGCMIAPALKTPTCCTAHWEYHSTWACVTPWPSPCLCWVVARSCRLSVCVSLRSCCARTATSTLPRPTLCAATPPTNAPSNAIVPQLGLSMSHGEAPPCCQQGQSYRKTNMGKGLRHGLSEMKQEYVLCAWSVSWSVE